jgi:hypothetical protein
LRADLSLIFRHILVESIDVASGLVFNGCGGGAMRTPGAESLQWAEEQFGAADLGDACRLRRWVHSAACRHEPPAGSLPAKLHDPADLEGFDRRANSNAVTHAKGIAAATARTHERMRNHSGVVLIAHDTTVLDYGATRSWRWRWRC